MLKAADSPLANADKWEDIRERFTKHESFKVVTEESERVRIFKDYIKSLKVSLCMCCSGCTAKLINVTLSWLRKTIVILK